MFQVVGFLIRIKNGFKLNMVNVLFGHDHFFKKDSLTASVYSNGGFPYSVFARYLNFFDSLTMLGRDGGVIGQEFAGTTIASGAGVDFELLPSISNLKSIFVVDPNVRERVSRLVAAHGGVICRLPSEIGLMLVSEAVRQRKPYAIEMVGCPYDAYANHGSFKARLYAPYAAYRVRRAVKNAKYVTYVTNSFLQSRYPCSNGVVGAFSDVSIDALDNQTIEARLEKIGNSSGKLVFGLIGNYSARYKGIDVAIKALAMARDSLPPFEFHVLGSGDSTYLHAVAKNCGLEESVFFDPSRSSGSAVNDWLDGVDLYLQPSLTEGLPRALVEAKSRACPAIGTSAGGISELLPADHLAKPGNVNELADLIIKMANDKSALIESAKRNFIESAEYTREKLEERRSMFWRTFRDSCIAG